jgi:Ribosomal protein L7/L12 C-terminal domain
MSEHLSKATINKLKNQIYEIQLGVDRYTLKDTIYQLIPSIVILQNRGYKLADISAYLSENGVIISDLTLSRYLKEIEKEARSIRREDELSSPPCSDPELNLLVSRIPAFEASEDYQVIFNRLSNESPEVKIAVLKAVRRVTGMSLEDAENIVESTEDRIFMIGVHKIVAEYVKYKIEKAGGIASIEKTVYSEYIGDVGDMPIRERFLPDFIDELEFYEILTLEQKQEFKNRCIFASERRKRVKKLCDEFPWES